MDKNKGLPPWVVALLRGAAEAAILAFLGVLAEAIGDPSTGDLAGAGPFAWMAIRTLEGIVDTKIDPTRQRVLGGRAAPSP